MLHPLSSLYFCLVTSDLSTDDLHLSLQLAHESSLLLSSTGIRRGSPMTSIGRGGLAYWGSVAVVSISSGR
jgi:hypothetical protein